MPAQTRDTWAESLRADGQRALSRRLLDHPDFYPASGMLVEFCEDDGTSTTRRFRDIYDFGIPPAYWEHFRDRFRLLLSDRTTAVILRRMAMGYGWSASRTTEDHYSMTRGRHSWDGDLGTVAAKALLAALDGDGDPRDGADGGEVRNLLSPQPAEWEKTR